MPACRVRRAAKVSARWPACRDDDCVLGESEGSSTHCPAAAAQAGAAPDLPHSWGSLGLELSSAAPSCAGTKELVWGASMVGDILSVRNSSGPSSGSHAKATSSGSPAWAQRPATLCCLPRPAAARAGLSLAHYASLGAPVSGRALDAGGRVPAPRSDVECSLLPADGHPRRLQRWLQGSGLSSQDGE